MNNDIGGTVIILILLVITGLIVYQLFYAENKSCPACKCSVHADSKACPSCNLTMPMQMPIEEKKIIVNVNRDDGFPPIVNPAREYDYRTFNDPLVPPYKRSDYDGMFPPGLVGGVPPIATRGYPSSFKKMGLLVDQGAENEDKFKFMVIMGRQTYPGSNQYDYYVAENKDESALKFDMKDLHKELNDGDSIAVSDLGKTYSVKLDRDLGFRYSPFVF
jgi:hypothetical protein